eukprot:m.49696 g.49696  ORF g.49696 m.49696 type:complete len:479 (+) comp12846_c0_seq1:384-1820(+)
MRSIADLVQTALADVAHPLEHGRVVVAHLVLQDTEVLDLQTRASKWHLKVDGDGRAGPLLLVHGGEQLNLSVQLGELAARHATDLPDDGVGARLVLGLALVRDDIDLGRVLRRRDDNLDLLAEVLRIKLGADVDNNVNLVGRLLHHRPHNKGQNHITRGAVLHELKLAIGRNEANGALGVEAAQLDALVEVQVVNRNGLAAVLAARVARLLVLVLVVDLVVDAKLALGHAGEVALHADGARDVLAEHGAVGRQEDVDGLQDVEEELVLAVLDALAAPADLAGHLARDLHLLLLRAGGDSALLDEHLEGVRIGALRVAKVQNLVQQLVDEREVALDVVLGEHAKVGIHQVDELAEEGKDLGGVCVLLGAGHQPHVGALDMQIACLGNQVQGRTQRLARVDDVHAEGIDGGTSDVVAVDAADQALALVVEDEHAADHSLGVLRVCVCQQRKRRLAARSLGRTSKGWVGWSTGGEPAVGSA